MKIISFISNFSFNFCFLGEIGIKAKSVLLTKVPIAGLIAVNTNQGLTPFPLPGSRLDFREIDVMLILSSDQKRYKNGTLNRRHVMVSKTELCNKIHELYPQIGECDIDLKVDWDEERNAWAVDFKKGVHRIKHYLEPEDAASCLEGKQCISLGLEFGQFVYGVS